MTSPSEHHVAATKARFKKAVALCNALETATVDSTMFPLPDETWSIAERMADCPTPASPATRELVRLLMEDRETTVAHADAIREAGADWSER